MEQNERLLLTLAVGAFLLGLAMLVTDYMHLTDARVAHYLAE